MKKWENGNNITEKRNSTSKPLCIIFAFILSIPLTVVIAFFLLKNSKADASDVEAFFTSLRVIGHRGSPENLPENTLDSFQQALLDGVDGIEFDISLTRDGFPILMHDDSLDRMTNMTGPISSKTLAELEDCYVGIDFNRTGPSNRTVVPSRIPELEDLIKLVQPSKVRLIFDMKDDNEKLVETISGMFRKHGLYNRSVIASFSPSVLYSFKRADPKFITVLIFRDRFYSTWYYEGIHDQRPRSKGLWQRCLELGDWLNMVAINGFLPSFLGVDGLMGYNKNINELWVQEQRDRGLHVLAWTVNELPEMLWMQEKLQVPFLTDRSYEIARLGRIAADINKTYA
ncbi:unnamed protein product, partial [Mesorhabditis spiculigera]